MATIGSLSVVFKADIKQLEDGVDRVSEMFDELKKSVEEFSSQLDDVSKGSGTIRVKADTSEVKKAAKEVEDLSDEIENKSPEVKIRVSGSLGKEFFGEARAQAKAYGESLVELSKETGAAIKASASAASAVGDVLDGTSASVSGIIVAIGRAEKAVGDWRVALASAAAATGAFVQLSGGMRTVVAAIGGSVGASARLLGALGGAAVAAGASVATFAGAMAVARVAASGLSGEAQENVSRWAALGAAAAASVVGIRAAGLSMAVIYKSFSESSTAAEFFASALRNASASVASFATFASRYIVGVTNVMTLARVASGEFRQSLARLGSEAEGIRNMADRFGATVEQMLILEYAARAASVGMSQLARASQAFFTNVSKVKIGQLGTPEAQEAKFAFDRLGLSIGDLRDKSPQQVFALVADRLVGVQDAADRAAIAFDLFGRQAVNVLPALKGLKDAEADSRRLGTTLSGLNFSLFEDVDTSFDRATEAAANFAEAMMAGFAPIQTAANNAFADIVGGAAAALAPIRNLGAAMTVPFQQFIEIAARVVNIVLRLVGAVAQVITAFLDAPALAGPWRVLGDSIKFALSYVEQFVTVVEDAARALFSELNPALEEGANALQQVLYVVQGFASVIVLGGIFNALGQRFRISLIGALERGWAILRSLNWTAAFALLRRAMQYVLIDSVNNAQRMVAMWVTSYGAFVAGFVRPFIAQVAVIITGNAAIATSFTVMGAAMAAAWIVGTLGIAALIVAIIAVIQNFSRLYDYFANFGDNVSKLFTLEGLAEAGRAVADAIIEAFAAAFNYIGGFFGRLIQNIILRVRGIKPPEKIDAARAQVGDVIESRRRQQMASFEARASLASVNLGPMPELPTDDYEGLKKAVGESRTEMVQLSFEAAKFGSAGSKAFLAAKADFAKLQQELSNDTLKGKTIIDENGVKRTETSLETFRRRYGEIQKSLRENINLADSISFEQLQQSAEEMVKTVDAAFADVRQISRGTDNGSTLTVDRFFPTSDAIKDKAVEFARNYEAELKRIDESLANGDFGDGLEAMKMAERERENAKDKFDRDRGKISADVSFASDIRKALEDAFLTPLDKYEKRLKEIADNASLSPEEKARATAMEQKQMVEGTFGKSAGESLRDKEAMFGAAQASRAFDITEGSRAAGDARAAAERNKLDIERRKAVGLDASPAQQLQAGVDNINDVFGVAGKSLAEIQATLSPKQFAEYQEALRKNRDSVLESVGVERSATQVRDEARKRLAGLALSAEEAAQANRAIADSFMSAIGVTKTPFEQFSGELDNIASKFGMSGKSIDEVRASLQGNKKDLELFDRAVKQSRDTLLQSLGIEKSPQQLFDETMQRITEAESATDPNKRITKEQADEARRVATLKRDEALGAGGAAGNFGAQFMAERRKIEEAFGGGRDPEKFRMAMDKLMRSAPGAEEESPVQKFQDSLKQLESIRGTIGEDEFAQRRKVLQAQLQEDLKPALDRVAPDRRAIESSDVRSKAGVDTFFRILRGQDNPSLKAQLETAKATKFLAEAAAQPEAAEVIAQLSAR